MDLFVAASPTERLHPSFRAIQQARKNHASRQIMQSVRIWELYLAGIFQNLRMDISQPHERPDFLVSRG
jgi:hypothetical protein